MNELQKTNTGVQVFKYNGTGITFKVGDNLMVNATEMAKSFNKRPVEWFRLPSTNDFLMAFIRDYEKDRGEKISLRYAEISLRKGVVINYTLTESRILKKPAEKFGSSTKMSYLCRR